MEASYCMAHECPSNLHCLKYEKEEDPNRFAVNFIDGLQLTKCPEYMDDEFDDLDFMIMMEVGLKSVKGAKESGYARRYGEHKKVQQK